MVPETVAPEPASVILAVMVAVAPTVALAGTMTNPVASIPATVSSDDDQVTVAVTSCVDPSAYVPVACNCTPLLTITEGLAGVTAMDTGSSLFTVPT